MRTNLSWFPLCKKCPASRFVCSNALTVHYYVSIWLLLVGHCSLNVLTKCFMLSRWWDRVQCPNTPLVFTICETLWNNELDQMLTHPSLKLLINTFNRTFIWSKQIDKSTNLLGFLYYLKSSEHKWKKKLIKSLQN